MNFGSEDNITNLFSLLFTVYGLKGHTEGLCKPRGIESLLLYARGAAKTRRSQLTDRTDNYLNTDFTNLTDLMVAALKIIAKINSKNEQKQ